MDVMIIAEAGVNHDGKIDQALRLIDAAAAAGADVVKFQTFKAAALASAVAGRAEYQIRNLGGTESQLDMLRRLELSEDDHFRLRDHCRQAGIGFLSSPFDRLSLEFLIDRLGLDTIKLGSGELTNGPLLLQAGASGRNIILSTGMADLAETAQAVGVIGCGANGVLAPTESEIQAAAHCPSPDLIRRLTLLHCTTEYPAPMDQVNLRAMETLRQTFGLRVGFSDHTPGITAAVAAAALGASVIEKHLTLDRGLPGPDHKASLEPLEMKALVDSVRQVTAALGDGRKVPMPSERGNADIARKSLAVAAPIGRGEVFTVDNLTAMRPGTGISPMQYWSWIGRTAERDYHVGDLVQP
ncbi:N-acetylneuraminate synthase [Magnetospirillum gryphiswaldense]|uniref:N-acetylneuraminate synthase n=1 Tax=Magnetospirillum gryphiswaldense TaxID=55518 RepID=A4U183_9PROT|nr:N-acetylneuraminate synthase [Magnetospirillum gryphiswaldense]AVM75579.1 N,N'-diacetyllegionaminic acid synthase [Magnetospirillum gryphiswaldense MSR-1]AVM79482.1 N,N'-diacetyllegionaminic acid synthase [Magnetospirillum gryphiswaldense]CAM76640.1 N-acetylneuraminate synthase [Magnetospirillum gryphiswaldense MSR-1]